MKKEEIVNKIKSAVPDIIEKPSMLGDVRFYYGFNEYSILISCNKFTYYDIDRNEEVEINLELINDDQLSRIINKAKKWASRLDKIRKGVEPYKDQIILIHPDCDEFTIPEILRDMKYIHGEEYDYRVGVLNTKDWDLSNSKLSDILTDRSLDCFAYTSIQSSEVADYLDDMSIFNQLIAEHPELKNCPIYITDYD
jgi:hypothetical protein